MKHSKSTLFLMELMIAILFFSISAAVCLNIFVKAHVTDDSTTYKTDSILLVQNSADLFLAKDGSQNAVTQFYQSNNPDILLTQGKSSGQNTLLLYYDSDLNFVTKEQAFYIEEIIFQEKGNFSYANISVTNSNQDITYYQIQVKKYIGGGTEND